ncbi:MAG: adenylate kinase [Planctomycetes bacterium]|nr:adenylate kinase [Planctomycetota bacterium]
MRRVVFLGPPGAGKGTQAARCAREQNLPHIATGDLLRQNVESGTPLGCKAKAFMDRGELVPDDLVIGMVDARLGHRDGVEGFLLDGYPRSVPQAEALDRTLRDRRVSLDGVLYFGVAPETLVERLGGRRTCRACKANYHVRFLPPKVPGVCDCGGDLVVREDDRPEAVRRRLDVYRDQTASLVAHYRARSVLHDVDAGGAPDAVAAQVARILDGQVRKARP